MITKIETKQQFLEIVPLLYEYAKYPKAVIGLDTETFTKCKKKFPRPTRNKDGGYNGYIRTLQIALSPDETLPIRGLCFVIDVAAIGCDMISIYLKDFFENITVIGQNLKYEYQFLFMHCGIKLRKMRDVMLMSQILYAGDKVQHGLGDLYARFLDYGWFVSYLENTSPHLVAAYRKAKAAGEKITIFEIYKRFKETNQTLDWEVEVLEGDSLQYGADDSVLMHPLFQAICLKIKRWREMYEMDFPSSKGMLEVIKLECACIPIFARMELRGIKLDKNYHEFTVIRYLLEKQKEAMDQLGFTHVKVTKKKVSQRWCTLKDKKEKLVVGPNRVSWDLITEEVVPMKLTSWQQLRPKLDQILSDALGEPFEIEGTKEDIIREVLNRRRRELPPETVTQILWILQYKKASSLLSKFGQKMIDMCLDTDYIHPGWFQIGSDEASVSSGRSTCKDPNFMQQPSRGHLFATKFDKEGKPLDGINVIKFFRSAFIAEHGWVLLDADYSQEEPRIAAEICNELPLIEDFRRFGKSSDIHSIIGKSLCGLDYYPPKGSYERDFIGKTGGLQLLYGAWWTSLKDFMYNKTDGKVDWSDEDAENAYKRFFEAYPNFRKEMDRIKRAVEAQAESFGWTLAPFKRDRRPFYVAFSDSTLGRSRRFCLEQKHAFKPDYQLAKAYKTPLVDENGEPILDENGKQITTYKNVYRDRMSAAGREGFNHRIQGAAADVLKVAILIMEEKFEESGFDWTEGIVAVIHDEVLVHVKEEHADIASKIMKESMTAAWERFYKRVPMFVDVDRASSWADAKEPPKKPALAEH